MNSHVKPASRFRLGTSVALIAAVVCISPGGFPRIALGQEATAASAGLSAAEIETLVAPIALYPDELTAIVLPASTFPVQIVQAARFLEKQKTDESLEPDEEWDSSVLGLLNYPEVTQMMNDDLSWTWKLGEAVVNQQQDVMAAIQGFRTKTDDAGNLESNEKVIVIKETEIIKIESASPEVIYVPTYNPTTVVVQQPAPYPYYYSAPYPYYYSPAAAVWTGMFVGAAISYGVHWNNHHHGHGYGDININRNTNINRNSTNVNRDSVNRNRTDAGRGSSNNWRSGSSTSQGGRPGRQPSSVSGSDFSTRTQSSRGTRVGDSRTGAGQASAQTGNRSASRQGTAGSAGSRTGQPSTSASSRTRQPSTSASSQPRSSSGSFSGYQSGANTARSSQRGTSSRSGMSGSSRGGGGRGGGGGRR